MKKNIALFILSFLLIIYQSYSQAKVGIGLKAGFNLTSFKTDYSNTDVLVKPGLTGGLYALIKLNNKISIQPEVVMSQQGTYLRPRGINNFDFLKYQYDFVYINVPLIAKYYVFKTFNIQAGPQIGMLLSAEGGTFDESGNILSEGDDVLDNYKKTDFAFCVGFGWDWRFGLSIDARYNHGLSDIQNESTLPSTKNRVIQLSLGYRFIKFGK